METGANVERPVRAGLSRLRVALAAALLTACVSARTILPADYARGGSWDHVSVRTVDGERFGLVDARFRGDSLIGRRQVGRRAGPRVAIPIRELASVRSLGFDEERTAYLIAGLAISLFLLGQWVTHSIT